MLTICSFRQGPTVTIQYKPNPDSHPEVLYSFFPKAVATTFSPKWAQLFPAVNQLSVAEMRNANPPVLTIVGGQKASHLAVLNWMLACCNGRGIQEFQRIPPQDKPFSRYYFLKESASLIGCSYIERKFEERMDALSTKQIHSEDVRALHKILPEDHEMLGFLAEHVAKLTWNQELKSKGAYYTLREEFPKFDEAVNGILDPLVEERRAQEKAEKDAYYQKLREQRKEQYNKQGGERRNGGKSNYYTKEKKPELEEPKEDATVRDQAKKIVPGAEDFFQIPFYKNKAAKRRQKKREEKSGESHE